VPLLTLFAASNELPEDDELLALHDRFLLRFVVDYVGEDFRFLKLLQARPPSARTTLALETLAGARAEVDALPVPGDVLRTVTDVRRELRGKGIVASDRRWAQAIGVLRAHAWLAGRDAVVDEDVPFLEHVLWRDPAERPQVRGTIRELLRGYEDEVRVLLYQSRELREYALRPWDTRELESRAALEAHSKIRNILGKVDSILSQARSGGRPVDRVEALRHEIAEIEREMLGRL
jgi:MoxR-like ATPase